MEKGTILVTGSTGYVGGRLVPRLLASGYRVRAVARSIEKLKVRSWSEEQGVDLFQADLLDYKSLKVAVNGCDRA
jgi:uncharacterized protein YbjT (DUF2867 family)